MDSWVIVQTFINPQEAYMAKAFLESAGIETRMQFCLRRSRTA